MHIPGGCKKSSFVKSHFVYLSFMCLNSCFSVTCVSVPKVHPTCCITTDNQISLHLQILFYLMTIYYSSLIKALQQTNKQKIRDASCKDFSFFLFSLIHSIVGRERKHFFQIFSTYIFIVYGSKLGTEVQNNNLFKNSFPI